MNSSLTRRVAVGLLAATATAVVVAVLVLPGGSAKTAAAPAPTASVVAAAVRDVPGVDYRDPATVCASFAAALFTADTTRDAGPVDAYRRAAGYADSAYSQALSTADQATTWQWQQWATHRVRTVVRVVAAISPTALASGIAGVMVTMTPVGADAWTGPTTTTLVTCTLTDTAGEWRVSHYQELPQ